MFGLVNMYVRAFQAQEPGEEEGESVRGPKSDFLAHLHIIHSPQTFSGTNFFPVNTSMFPDETSIPIAYLQQVSVRFLRMKPTTICHMITLTRFRNCLCHAQYATEEELQQLPREPVLGAPLLHAGSSFQNPKGPAGNSNIFCHCCRVMSKELKAVPSFAKVFHFGVNPSKFSSWCTDLWAMRSTCI